MKLNSERKERKGIFSTFKIFLLPLGSVMFGCWILGIVLVAINFLESMISLYANQEVV